MLQGVTTQKDTIVAISTSRGQGGIGVVRLSGSRARAILEKLCAAPRSTWNSHEMFHVKLLDPVSRETLDDVMAVWLAAPKTYTGEDVVEISAHGNPLILQAIVEACIKLGARMARPGEFTERAYLAGKLDLLQAEAVAELIHAETEAELRLAKRRLSGKLSGDVDQLYDMTISILAECEADIDFPDENLPVESRKGLLDKITATREFAQKLLATHAANQRLQDGFKVVLAGSPNAGKSSLFNACLHHERAIVTPVPGTTRDVLREELVLLGRKIRLIDTAGLRDTPGDAIEAMGIKRTRTEVEGADLVCLVIPADVGVTWEDRVFLENFKAAWVVWNKVDIAAADLKPIEDAGFGSRKQWRVSAKTGEGLAAFKAALGAEAERQTPSFESGGISNDRQKILLSQFLELFTQAEALWKGEASAEFASFEFRQALKSLGEMVGKSDHQENILDTIFARFCIGK